jgi:hypothetical protein
MFAAPASMHVYANAWPPSSSSTEQRRGVLLIASGVLPAIVSHVCCCPQHERMCALIPSSFLAALVLRCWACQVGKPEDLKMRCSRFAQDHDYEAFLGFEYSCWP